MYVKTFFNNLPEPDIMSEREVLSCVQVADRFYRISNNDAVQHGERDRSHNGNKKNVQRLQSYLPTFQFRLVLNSPCIILVSDSTRTHMEKKTKDNGKTVTLRLAHFDFLYHNEPSTEMSSKTFFVHNLELFTGSANHYLRGQVNSSEHSLLNPVCIGAQISDQFVTEDEGKICKKSKWISSDVISARAAFTDMTLAIDVLLNVISDFKEVAIDLDHRAKADSTLRAAEEMNEDQVISDTSSFVLQESLDIACGGFILLAIDDSGRHFASSQELIQVSLSGLLFNRSEGIVKEAVDFISYTRLQLNHLELLDCLQPTSSPFRVITSTTKTSKHVSKDTLTLEERMNQSLYSDFMTWEKNAMSSDSWGYRISPSMAERCSIAERGEMNQSLSEKNLFEIRHTSSVDLRHDYYFKIRDIVVQWNPSMVIALQRFLGRLRKEAKTRILLPRTSGNSSLEEQRESSIPSETKESSNEVSCLQESTKATFEIDSLTLCLNKEHQNRRLLQITLSQSSVAIERDMYLQLDVHGCIGDLNVWDADGDRIDQHPLCHSNRLVVGVLHDPLVDEESCSSMSSNGESSDRFLSFRYHSQTHSKLRRDKLILNGVTNHSYLSLPEWVIGLVGEGASIDTVDDCLSLKIATIRFNYIRERTGEMMDYLSNGLPGKGMGATSKAAQGFITKRIQTRSFLDISVNSPQLFLPQHRGDENGVILCLGDVCLKSWFEEATVADSEATGCDKLSSDFRPSLRPQPPEVWSNANGEPIYWWRVLSISFIGIGWRTNNTTTDSLSPEQNIEHPVSLFLQWRKPPSKQLANVVRSRLSHVDFNLTYNDYLLLRSILSDNLVKDLDVDSWDNVEKAFLMEQAEPLDKKIPMPAAGSVKYSKNARFVRYGAMAGSKAVPPCNTLKTGYEDGDSFDSSLDENRNLKANDDDVSRTRFSMKFSLEGLNLVLHRNDQPHDQRGGCLDVANIMNYDMLSFQLNQVGITLSINADGSKSSAIEISEVSLYDLGDVGRLSRERSDILKNEMFQEGNITGKKLRRMRKPSAFSVIAQGYETSEDDRVLTVDTTSPPSQSSCHPGDGKLRDGEVTTIRATINCMNINPLIRPLVEVGQFFSCKWGEKNDCETNDGQVDNDMKKKQYEVGTNSKRQGESHSKTGGVHFKMTAKYPRIFLLANESDPFSRALVLRGLVIVDVNILRENALHKRGIENKSSPRDLRTLTSAEIHFQCLESYINADASSALDQNSAEIPEETSIESLGVALIEPVTGKFVFHQVKRENFPTSRAIHLSMDPVSTTLSFEDIRLIEAVVARWKSERKLSNEDESHLKDIALMTDFADTDESNQVESILVMDDSLMDHFPDEDALDDISPDTIVLEERSNSSIGSDDFMEQRSFCCGHYDYLPNILSNFPSSLATSRDESNLFNTDHKDDSIQQYSVTFKGKTLGLILRKSASKILVDKVSEGQEVSEIGKGDEVLLVEGKSVCGMSFQSVLALLNSIKRPVTIDFLRTKPTFSGNEDKENSIDETTSDEILFHADITKKSEIHSSREGEEQSKDWGNPHKRLRDTNSEIELEQLLKTHCPITVVMTYGQQHGLAIEKSLCGDVATVTHINREIFDQSRKKEESNWVYTPNPGAVIVALNGKAAITLGYKKIVDLLQENAESLVIEEKDTYTLTFLEAPSDEWGIVDQVEVIISGIKLTLIDDINGRDMPFLRGSLNSITMRVDRGLGLECNSIKVSPPSILLFPNFVEVFSDTSSPQFQHHHEHVVTSAFAESVLKCCSNFETQLEYYNARIAGWEPLLEPCHLSGELEYQSGNDEIPAARPGNLSLALSDYQAIIGTDALQQKLICLNITDAAADILLTTSKDWNTWRKKYKEDRKGRQAILDSLNRDENRQTTGFSGKSLKVGVEDDTYIQSANSDITPVTSPGSDRVAAQNAAQAALIFAQRRGADTQNTEGSKPFMLKNKTGMPLSFVPQTSSIDYGYNLENEENISFESSAFNEEIVKKVDDGDEARFSLDTAHSFSSESTNFETNKSDKKVRIYDGQFPLLSLSFEPIKQDISLAILKDMSVVKIGKTLRRLRTRKYNKENDSFDFAYVMILWTVELENNRRIITVSSAICISSPSCGLPIEIGVKRHDGFNQNSEESAEDKGAFVHNQISPIGISTSRDPFYLPLWIELSCEKAEIYIRPSSSFAVTEMDIFQWCSKRILLFDRRNMDWDVEDSQHNVCCRLNPNFEDNYFQPVWLSYSCLRDESNERRDIRYGKSEKYEYVQSPQVESLSIRIFSNLSLRNVVPEDIEWEISCTQNGKSASLLDGSNVRKLQKRKYGFSMHQLAQEGDEYMLCSGHGTDIFACESSVMNIRARFRCTTEKEWTHWISLDSGKEEENVNESVLKEGTCYS